MDFVKWNKIAGGLLGAILFAVLVRYAVQQVFTVEPPAQPAYVVEGLAADEAPPFVAAPPRPALPDFGTAIPAANTGNGDLIAERCGVCHDWTREGPHRVGPNLFGIVGRARASAPGFTYSPAMRGLGGEWGYADLFDFLGQPALVVPGTTMVFAGVPSEQDRIDLIAFMRMWADVPAPLPPPENAPAPIPGIVPAPELDLEPDEPGITLP